MNYNILFYIPFLLKNIVIAPHEIYMQISKIFSPPGKKIQLLIRIAVEHVANHYQSIRLEKLNLRHEPLHILSEYKLRNRNPFFSEMSCFAKVKIRHNQTLFIFPEN